MQFQEFIDSTKVLKSLQLPGEEAHLKMVPPFRRELLNKHDAKKAKQSAVLALFYPNKTLETTLVLILRKPYNGVHSAQVSFPGGKVETHDNSLQHTATRETFEEIGVHTQQIEILKSLTEVYIPPSNFNVQPFIGFCNDTPSFKRDPKEVENIIEVPLKSILDDSNVILESVTTSYSTKAKVPAFKLNNHIVWGATAMMLSEIKDLIKQML